MKATGKYGRNPPKFLKTGGTVFELEGIYRFEDQAKRSAKFNRGFFWNNWKIKVKTKILRLPNEEGDVHHIGFNYPLYIETGPWNKEEVDTWLQSKQAKVHPYTGPNLAAPPSGMVGGRQVTCNVYLTPASNRSKYPTHYAVAYLNGKFLHQTRNRRIPLDAKIEMNNWCRRNGYGPVWGNI